MLKRMTATLLALVLAGSIGGTVSAKAFDGGSTSTACGDGIVTVTPAKMWPPNHKLKDVSVSYDETSDDGDTLTVSVDLVTHSEEGFEKGSTAKKEPDFVNLAPTGSATDAVDQLPATVTLQLRKERMGRSKDGRTYDLTVTCTDSGDAGATNTVQVFVIVPHDRRS